MPVDYTNLGSAPGEESFLDPCPSEACCDGGKENSRENKFLFKSLKPLRNLRDITEYKMGFRVELKKKQTPE